MPKSTHVQIENYKRQLTKHADSVCNKELVLDNVYNFQVDCMQNCSNPLYKRELNLLYIDTQKTEKMKSQNNCVYRNFYLKSISTKRY